MYAHFRWGGVSSVDPHKKATSIKAVLYTLLSWAPFHFFPVAAHVLTELRGLRSKRVLPLRYSYPLSEAISGDSWR